jgi:hypothetical protein
MQAIFEFVAGLVAALASIAFAQFGVPLHGAPSQQHAQPAEVHRTVHPRDGRVTKTSAERHSNCPYAHRV